jgi:hypothetical protein
MSVLSDNQINAHIDKLLNFVDSLPMDDKGIAYIRAKIIVDFLDTWQFDDETNNFSFNEYISNPSNPRFTDVQTTYGIRNAAQIERWTEGFKTALKKTRGKALENLLKELDKLHPAIKAARLSKSLAAITRAELFEKHGIQSIKDPEWNNQLKEILGTEINFSKEQADLLTKAPYPQQQDHPNDEEVLIVEELENRLAIEAVEYNRKFNDLWESYKFDPTYFDSFISGPLLIEFSKSVYNRIRPLNNQEINRYLSLSLQQFKTHTPPKRHKAFLLNYHNTYWFPNMMDYKENEYDFRYATHVWKHYTTHFKSFKETLQKIYDDFRAGLIGMPDLSLPPFKTKKSALSFKYIHLSTGLLNITDLMNSLKRFALIHQDTTLANFRSVFSEKEIEHKIIWTGNISELAHFIKTLHNTAKKVQDTKQKQWEITTNCFQMNDGLELSKNKLRIQKKPARAAIIEKAIQIL